MKNLLIAALLLLVSCEKEVVQEETEGQMHANGIITKPVGFWDVQPVLGTTEEDMAILCTHPNINKWSRFKPVDFGALFTRDYPDWWRGADRNCGFTIPVYNNITALKNAVVAKTTDWVYDKRPTGGQGSPSRILDFDGYNHNAISWIDAQTIPSNVDEQNFIIASIDIPFGATTDGIERKRLVLSDFDFFNSTDFYLALCIYNSSGKTLWATRSRNMHTPDYEGQFTLSVTPFAHSMPVGTWNAFLFLVNTNSHQTRFTDSTESGIFIPIPNVEIKTITRSEKIMGIEVLYGTVSSNKINAVTYVYNYLENALTITGCKLWVLRNGRTPSSNLVLQAGESITPIRFPDTNASGVITMSSAGVIWIDTDIITAYPNDVTVYFTSENPLNETKGTRQD